MYTRVTNCRACGAGPLQFAPNTKSGHAGEPLKKVFSLGIQPLANDFVKAGGRHQGFAPLEVLMCPKCGLAQLSVVVDPIILYGGDYLYVTSKTQMMQDHFKALWDDCTRLAENKNVLEIGSNDGDFLEYCRTHGAEQVLGIEPADNLAKTARDRGIETLCDFFTTAAAKTASQRMPKVGIIVARHVFCHVNDWLGFMKALEVVAGDDTIICIETPYAPDQLSGNSFDQIYHEHLSYMSIRAIQALLNSGPFQLHAVYHYEIHGGAIAMMIRRRNPNIPAEASVYAYMKNEQITEQTWKEFGVRCRDQITNLKLYVQGLAGEGKRVAGLGASAKSTVWIHACGFTKNEIRAVYDCTPEKWYRFIPGTEIPIINEGAFYVDDAHYAVCFAWNFLPEVLKRHKKWMEGGGKFIVPVPHVKVIGIDSETG